MRTAYIPVNAKVKIELTEELIKKLKEKVALFTTVQYLNQYDNMKKRLEKAGKKVISIKTKHTKHPGQLLGCNLQPLKKYSKEEFDCTLFVGDGEFHPKALLWKNDVQSIIFNPHTKKIKEIKSEEIKRIQKKHYANLYAFKQAKTVGVLIPHKPGGQTYLKWALDLEKMYPEKTFINLVDYNINFSELENYPFCEVFVNAACPRIAYEDLENVRKPIVNLEDINKEFLKRQTNNN